ncbi:ATP-binding cassette domain-containing protein [Pseudoleptotrichia goodfellowii]|uniref:AlsA ABC superfamily (Atp_bind), allose transport protein (Second module) n=1 Tax=Pseudoleptotrichia goodfellowii F0264 TaxID=596323 RepID=D0GJF9_9FUSO|nr:ATP-binding cassette domain-containing protein [Pseudoleptotrichia goodfellowii]EEY35772.1 AlsA ABC superfamily (atp_bind), allose transport protein (second module) [Pseudoleptotrichia goodfellowii F0264]
MNSNPLVEMKSITKKFGVVTALNEISFKINRGEVHVLLGENGAGKSTLMKILSGVYQPTSGKIIINGRDYDFLTPKLSFENKISIIYQELSVIDELSIQENLFVGKLPVKKVLGIETVDYQYMENVTKKILSKIGLDKDPYTTVEELTISEKQQVEIAKALAANADIIIMDEPTTSLTETETNHLFKIIRQLKLEGKGIVYISHKLKELKEIGDIVTVLKDGKDVGTKDIKTVDIKDLVTMMVGREIKSRYDSNNPELDRKEIIFEVNDLTRSDEKVKDISFKIHKGEILGFAGLVGSGRSELMEAIFGVEPIKKGTIKMFGKESVPKNEYDSIKKGMGFVTENRRETGFFHNFDIKQNISILPFIKSSKFKGTWGLTDNSKEKEYALKGKNQLNIKCASIDQNITELSGGNQQKVILSKWMMADSSLIIFDEPTKGIDIGSKSEIYTIIRKLSDEGKIIMMISSEMPELLAVCDKIAVFKEGRIAEILPIEKASEEAIMRILTSEGVE